MTEIIDTTDIDIDIGISILDNIYVKLGSNLLSDSNYKFEFNSDFIFRSHIPDFIESNEDKFINENSSEYINFITDKINNYYKSEIEYILKPCYQIIFKLHQLFPNSYSTLIMYNQMYDNIKSLSIESTFIFFKCICTNNRILTLKSENVLDSCLYHAYNLIGVKEKIACYFNKVFMCHDYKLLLSEFNFLDTYDISSPSFNNLKWLIFKSGLEQATIPNEYNPINLEQIIDISIIPPISSSKFSIFMSWYLLQKIKNLPVPEIIIEDEYLNLDVNKIYKYFIDIDNLTVRNIIKWINEYDFRLTSDPKLFERYSIDTIFNSKGHIYKTMYDYIDNSKYILKVIKDKYHLFIKPSLIETDTDEFYTQFKHDENDDDSDIDINNDEKEYKSNYKISKSFIQKGGIQTYGIYKYNIDSDIINIYTVLPFCKIFYFIRHIN